MPPSRRRTRGRIRSPEDARGNRSRSRENEPFIGRRQTAKEVGWPPLSRRRYTEPAIREPHGSVGKEPSSFAIPSAGERPRRRRLRTFQSPSSAASVRAPRRIHSSDEFGARGGAASHRSSERDPVPAAGESGAIPLVRPRAEPGGGEGD